jgi:hypothetical protein
MNKGEQTTALIRDLLSLNEEERSPLSDPTSWEAEERRSRRNANQERIGPPSWTYTMRSTHQRLGRMRWCRSMVIHFGSDKGPRIKREILHDQNDERPYTLQMYPL